jgi:hypothetical protein
MGLAATNHLHLPSRTLKARRRRIALACNAINAPATSPHAAPDVARHVTTGLPSPTRVSARTKKAPGQWGRAGAWRGSPNPTFARFRPPVPASRARDASRSPTGSVRLKPTIASVGRSCARAQPIQTGTSLSKPRLREEGGPPL